MRKLLAGLLTLALCLTLLSTVPRAEEPTEAELTLEDFTLESARRMIAENKWEGMTGSVDGAGVKLWRENSLARMDLTQEMEDAGYLAVFYSSNLQLVVMLQDYGMDFAEYKNAVEESGYENVRQETVNGREFLLYDESREEESFCRVAAAEEDDGQMLEFIFFYTSADMDTLVDVIIATIRNEEAQSE